MRCNVAVITVTPATGGSTENLFLCNCVPRSQQARAPLSLCVLPVHVALSCFHFTYVPTWHDTKIMKGVLFRWKTASESIPVILNRWTQCCACSYSEWLSQQCARLHWPSLHFLPCPEYSRKFPARWCWSRRWFGWRNIFPHWAHLWCSVTMTCSARTSSTTAKRVSVWALIWASRLTAVILFYNQNEQQHF